MSGFSLQQAKRIVIKIGSALLVDEAGHVRQGWLNALADDIAVLKRMGKDVLVVSSGSIAVGRRHLGLAGQSLKLEEKQASAATGQIRLAHAYQQALGHYEITVAQILVTLADTEERRRHLNARNTMLQLLSLGAVPVINENDTVATEEIRYGDNDRLAARVATMVSADALILLSDIDGLYAADPRKNPDAEHFPEVTQITEEIEAMAGDAPEGISTGGMVTKLAAAKIAVSGGCHMAIALGTEKHPVQHLLDGGRCTWFRPGDRPMTARKKWIAGTLKTVGEVVVDAGAAKALMAGKSLLPAGIRKVAGRFDRGDAIQVTDMDGRKVAVGLAAYGAEEAERVIGRKTSEIKDILGYEGRMEMIHADDLALQDAVE
ncbi:glutamate 5-kinase [Aestuariispira insulae]|uniref:Glutamate 5-kinase n=1 Tax=Aestuariispira insulae TaxID=1461337 RepID=A0A3D9H8M1_9PROT|nr:glutamate 5-kinase [Aestuariispira insulae]RED45843.1 glutamate 5-kinase [Aestuariispira insulae]